jgi:hypothetical protein
VADDLAWRVPSTLSLAMSSSVTRVSIASRIGAGVRPVHGCKRTGCLKRFLADTVIPRTLAQILSSASTAKSGSKRVRALWKSAYSEVVAEIVLPPALALRLKDREPAAS